MTYNLKLRVEFIGKLSSLAELLQPSLIVTFQNIAAIFFLLLEKVTEFSRACSDQGL
jgi:hypothetical protein